MKQNIRYVGFRSTADGGRKFDFSVSASGQESMVSVDIAASNFAGAERVLIQEYSSICYSKVKKLFEDGVIDPVGIELVLTDSDVTQYRALQPEPEPRKVRADRVPY
jgi:hypothetical protein